MLAMPGRKWVLSRCASRLLAFVHFLPDPGFRRASVFAAYCLLIFRMDTLMATIFPIVYWTNLARHVVLHVILGTKLSREDCEPSVPRGDRRCR